MMVEKREITYNSNLLKGTGLIQEMLVLIGAYLPGETAQDFQKRVLEEGLLSKSTDNRTIDIVRNIFRPRFLDQKLDVTNYIKYMREQYVSMDVITQLFLIYTCRANPILADFIAEVYHRYAREGRSRITADDPKVFIRAAIADGRIPSAWSDSTVNKVSEHINACLIDFRLTNRSKETLPFRAMDITVNYLLHELHFQGLSDMEILHHQDWKIFDLDANSLTSIAERLSFTRTFVFQYSGQILKIAWSCDTMQDFLENEFG